ncbi:DMP19 family protein [Compostimonas suwonensis]|uniref:Uncharacterized protein DUF4375 n=1 Tax=Compostimonas suwonensis TaxID=1048394 RepID=A0A2M9BUQ8_9MICO|nr:DUF4375 domain-containing protein [Compostimonas suwonensis]PJJ61673.1 uncharacterized protein DUF4375 [Compostimonas suwonensis]
MASELPVVVSAESIEEGADSIVYSNVTIVNALLSGLLEIGEIAPNAIRSYYVDYYLAEVSNGGFAQFVVNSGLPDSLVEWVRDGLEGMDAHGHAALFERAVDAYQTLNDEEREGFLEGEFFGDSETRDILEAVDDEFERIDDAEDLTELNAAWLTALPELRVVPRAEVDDFVASRIALIDGLEARRAAAEAGDPAE